MWRSLYLLSLFQALLSNAIPTCVATPPAYKANPVLRHRKLPALERLEYQWILIAALLQVQAWLPSVRSVAVKEIFVTVVDQFQHKDLNPLDPRVCMQGRKPTGPSGMYAGTLKPTVPLGSDLSCYSCSSVNIPGVPTEKANCKNPAKQTCGAGMAFGMQQDRCVRMKLIVGGVVQEMRNCSGAFMCNKDLVCNNANKTGIISSCDVSCCYGNLCNTDVTPTTTPITTAVPTAVGSGNTLTGAMTCLLVVIGK
ncbi:hypothetical protein QZH41_009709, partial [Actinostola sp. cb2023]